MGNQPSKTRSGTSTANQSSTSLADGVPMSKSDTMGSTRSFRGTLKNKIYSNKNTDSPATSQAQLSTSVSSNTGEGFDAASPNSARVKRESRGATAINTNVATTTKSGDTDAVSPSSAGTATSPKDGEDDSGSANDEQPPSPVHGDLSKGHHALEAPNGEIGNVSDMPAGSGGGSVPAHATMQPGESILMKREGATIPIAAENMPNGEEATPASAVTNASTGTSPGGMGMSALRSIDLDDMINRLLDAGYAGKVTKSVCLKNAEIIAVCQAAREVLLSQPSLIELAAPVKIVGDVHGQYSDLIRMFEMCGFPPHSNYLFLGDYVDRGKQSLETILLLLCYKLKFPENFFILRGNHECASVSRVYGFYDECKRRTSVKIWKAFVDTFNTLPLAAIVASKIFCVHGGLSPSLQSMSDIRNIARPTDVPDYGLLNDLLWSDPADMSNDWEENERGVSYCFGKNVIYDFLAKFDFDLVCRAHMVVEDGYEFFNERTLVTVFSAPNYCGMFDNWGAVMSVSTELLCSFELLKPLDGQQLKMVMKKGRSARKGLGAGLQSPPANGIAQSY